MEHIRELQSDQDKDEPVQHKFHHVPNGTGIETGLKISDLRKSPAEIQAASNYRQNSGDAEVFGRQIRGEWRQQGYRNFDGGIHDAAMKLFRQPADDQSDQNAADADNEKSQAGMSK